MGKAEKSMESKSLRGAFKTTSLSVIYSSVSPLHWGMRRKPEHYIISVKYHTQVSFSCYCVIKEAPGTSSQWPKAPWQLPSQRLPIYLPLLVSVAPAFWHTIYLTESFICLSVSRIQNESFKWVENFSVWPLFHLQKTASHIYSVHICRESKPFTHLKEAAWYQSIMVLLNWKRWNE